MCTCVRAYVCAMKPADKFLPYRLPAGEQTIASLFMDVSTEV